LEQDLQANSLRLKITTKNISLEYVRQISRQKPEKASVVRQLKKAYCEMIGMGAKSITIVRAVTADFFFDCRAAEVPSDE
jgi:soluble P-type ATPase